MERGVYFDGWYRNNHCYHPSLPMRSMQMVEDLEKYKATLLVWSALGGGSISLPYLEHEAYGAVDPRLRFYGYMNDSEFIAECNKRGIKVFGIVFEVQGWEFPAIFNENNSEFKALNVIRDDSKHSWYGLREFTSGRYDNVFGKSLKDYFPEGLYNSMGEEVADIWEECAARDYNGVPCHSEWVEVVGHKHIAYQMCRNNPVWRQYLKKIMEIQIDAGVAGVQLDECELPMTSIRYGGCFCKDCMSQFNEYLKDLEGTGVLPEELEQMDLDTFNYGEFLRNKNITYPGDIVSIPYYKFYWDFQLHAIKKHFDELVHHAKEYARSKGREVLVSGNFFNLMPSYYALEPGVDVIITEMKQTVFKASHWYRYAAGFAGDKPIIIVENPYGGVVPELVEMLDIGKGFDLYRIMLLEGSVFGCNMAVPYGAWMGNTIKNAFYPPRGVTTEIQDFIADNEKLFSKCSGSNILVLYSFPSNYWNEAIAGYADSILDGEGEGVLSYSVTDLDDPNSTRMPFWEVIKNLSDRNVNYDVKMLADGDLRVDSFSETDLQGYDMVVLPDCSVLTENQAKALEKYVAAGHRLLAFGKPGKNLESWFDNLLKQDNVVYCENDDYKPKALQNFFNGFEPLYEDIWQIKCDHPNIGYQMHKTQEGMAIHVINYSYVKEEDRVVPIDELAISLRLGSEYGDIRVNTLTGNTISFDKCEKDGVISLKLKEVPVYAVIELE